jgi:hypothetical protein
MYGIAENFVRSIRSVHLNKRTSGEKFTAPDLVYICMDIMTSNLVGDSLVRLVTPTHLPSRGGHRNFEHPSYMPSEESLQESVSTYQVTRILTVRLRAFNSTV